MSLFKFFTLLIIVCFTSSLSYSQLYINELSASNSSIIEDPDYKKYSDWFEIYNPGIRTINLFGYYLTDNLKNPVKWKINSDLLVGPGKFLIIWTDGKDSANHASFKLAQVGEEIGLYSPEKVLIDSVVFPEQKVDLSYGRSYDGATKWGYFIKPTPGDANNTTFYNEIVYNFPRFSIPGGFFKSNIKLELLNDLGGTIRYTLDGTDPAETSLTYNQPLTIKSTTVVRARIFKSYMVPGPIITNSYFINEDLENRKLPVISISTDPKNFWDKETGIYVQKFKPLWEVPINIELFENNGNDRAAFNELAGTKVNGLYSWQLPQKMLGVYFEKQYGVSNLAYPLFFDRDCSVYKSFALRASGSDWSYTMFRDGLIQNATALNMNVDRQGFRPSIVYVNGQYMGIHNIRSKVDEDYIQNYYGLAAGSFDMVSNQNLAEAGDLNAYNELLVLLGQDLSVKANYDAVAERIDIENFTDFAITEIYDGNTSVDHNIMAWRPKDSGKWRWLYMDFDRGFFKPTENLISTYVNKTVIPLKRLLLNPDYKDYFGKRLADHFYTTFNTIYIKKMIEYHKQLIEVEMPNHIDRWFGTTSTYGDAMPSLAYWNDQVCNLKTFADARPQAVLDDLRNYGFSGTAILGLSVSPINAGTFLFNGLKVSEPNWTGSYLKNMQIELKAEEKPGFSFKGWTKSVQKVVIPKKSIWKYLDDGSDQSIAWRTSSFNDSNWKSGKGELGYGDGDEATVVESGSDENNKYITTYFRNAFQVTELERLNNTYILNLLMDDGAVVYLNGVEVVRAGIGCGELDYKTLAKNISERMESQYTSYLIDAGLLKTGNNVLAIEIHQSAKNSSDLSFDLELLSSGADNSPFISTNKNYSFLFTDHLSLIAVYQPTGQCIIPSVIDKDYTLRKNCSPYAAQGDVTISKNATLTIEPGVEIQMPVKANIIINGKIKAIGKSDQRILFKANSLNAGQSWGVITFLNASDTSKMSFVTIENSSKGLIPIRDIAAITLFNSKVVLDHMIIENVEANPIACRYSSIRITNSLLHEKIVGDAINIKFGTAWIENCEIRGNNQESTDAIDFDDVQNSTIRSCKIHDFTAFNSDALDLGESTNIKIDSVLIYDIFDKGISVGLRTDVKVTNCTFVNCNIGLAIKDSSHAVIDHCTFYNVGTPVSCYEKIIGRAGGNAIVTNSILSNSSTSSYFFDSKSKMFIKQCLSDNDTLPVNSSNLFGNPLFVSPSYFDFHLKPASPARKAGLTNGKPVDLGSLSHKFTGDPSLMINSIYYQSLNNTEESEYISILNPSVNDVDMSDYKITKGFTFTFPKGTVIKAGDVLYLAKNKDVTVFRNFSKQIFQWETGTLVDEGETLQLENNTTMVLDHVKYSPNLPWPSMGLESTKILTLISPELDNHFPESWTSELYTRVDDHPNLISRSDVSIFPNPVQHILNLKAQAYSNAMVRIYSITGKLIETKKLDANGSASFNTSKYDNTIILVMIGNHVKKIAVIK